MSVSIRTPGTWLLSAAAALLLVTSACKPAERAVEPPASTGFQEDPTFVSSGQADRAADNYSQQCATCHGALGDGAGPVGAALSPPPTDFTAARVPAHRAFEAIRGGGMAVGKAATMAPFGSVFNDEQIHDLVAYVRAFAP